MAEIIPTSVGSYSLVFQGQVENQNISTTVPIEDVEGTSKLEFPFTFVFKHNNKWYRLSQRIDETDVKFCYGQLRVKIDDNSWVNSRKG